MASSTFTYEGISFNKEWAAGISEAEFVKHEKHHGLTATQLKEAYKLIKSEVNKAKKNQIPLDELPASTVSEEGKVITLEEAKDSDENPNP